MTPSWRARDIPIDPARVHAAEVERLLAGRIRHIAFGPALNRLYERTSWRSRGMAARGWFMGGIVIDLSACGLDGLTDPRLLLVSLIYRVGVFTAAYGLLWLSWRQPRAAWLEGLTLVLAAAVLLLVSARLGFAGGLLVFDRYLTLGMVLGATGVVIVPVQPLWSTVTAAVMTLLYVILAAMNTHLPVGGTLAMGLFLSVTLSSMVYARKINAVVSHHSFLLRLKSEYQSMALTAMNLRLDALAKTDALTGLGNRRAFELGAEALWRRQAAAVGAVGLILLDIDHFKKLNDAAGHAAGDRSLVGVAHITRDCTERHGIVVARHGGEEFICAMACSALPEVLEVAETIRTAVEALCLPNPGLGPAQRLTVSLGCSLGQAEACEAPQAQLQTLIEWADLALYDAKARGRNRVAARLPSPEAGRAA